MTDRRSGELLYEMGITEAPPATQMVVAAWDVLLALDTLRETAIAVVQHRLGRLAQRLAI